MDLPQQDTIIQYVADGTETEYVFAFYVPTAADIAVYTQAANATPVPESDLNVLNVDYTVAFNEDPITGGTVTFLGGHVPASGWIITLNRDVQASLDVQFSNAQNFNGANLDDALERLLLLIQQNKTYSLQRNLSYRVNTYLPDLEVESNTQLQTLQDGYIWKGQNGGVISTLLEENPDVSTLRTDLANNSPTTNGASLVGYYDPLNVEATTVKDFLDDLPTYIYDIINEPLNNKIFIDVGSANLIRITTDFPYTEYSEGDRFLVRINVNNTGASNLAVNDIAAEDIIVSGDTINTYPYDLSAGSIAEFEFNNGKWFLINPNSCLMRRSILGYVALTVNQAFPSGSAFTKILYNTVVTDTYSMWDAVNHGFNISIAGNYRITTYTRNSWAVDNTIWTINVYKNNSIYAAISGATSPPINQNTFSSGSIIIPSLIVGDFIDTRAFQTGTAVTDDTLLQSASYCQIEYAGR